MRILRLAAATLVCSLVLAACGGGDDDDDGDATATIAPSVTVAAVTPEPTVSSEIRSMDLEMSEPVQGLIVATGGTFSAPDVLYADLTEDNVEDAIVPISSGGTAGNLAVTVVTPSGDHAVEELLHVTADEGGGLVANVVDGQLVITQPAPGPDDPECCPSQLKTTIYQWDGSALVIESETTAPNEQGASKTPTSP